MQVFQLIYTKVAPEESPWKKADFHTVFYPIDLMTKQDVFEIERRIHFPQIDEFKEKETIFYQRIQDKDYLIILHIRSLPEARDIFGRGGIFICHGFIFPPELWEKVASTTTLFELVKGSLFSRCEDVLSSSLIDRKTGNIQALDIPEEKLKRLPTVLPKISTEFEWKMVILLNRIASMKGEERPALLFKGEPEKVSTLINKCIAYIPDNYKPAIGYDPAFDNGNLTFYPMKIVGFKHICPTGGNPIRIDLESYTLEESPERSSLFYPQTAYEKWLTYCRNEVVSKEQIEGTYNLSLILETETITPTTEAILSQRIGFASVNKEKIKDVFLKRCSMVLGEIITKYLSSMLTPEALLDLIIEGIPPAKLVNYVEDVILRNRLTPELIKVPFPEPLIKTGSCRLALIERLWKGEALKHDELMPLEEDQRLEFIRYLLLAEWKDKDWVLDILRENEEIFRHLLASYETKEVVENLILKLISKEKDFKEIAEFMLKEVIKQEKEFAILRKEIGLMGILEEAIKRGVEDDSQIKRLILWAKKRRLPDGEFPYIRVFLYPRQGLSEDILRDTRINKRLIKWLMQYYRYKIKDLEGLGFDKDKMKIKEQIKGKGWMEKAKGILGLREE